MFKYISIAIVASAALSAGVWSNTQMQVATGQLTPFVSSQMSNITAKVSQINTKYSAELTSQMELKTIKTKEIRNLEKEILFELKKINHNQELLNRIEVQND